MQSFLTRQLALRQSLAATSASSAAAAPIEHCVIDHSPHVQHLRVHPQLYGAALRSFFTKHLGLNNLPA